MSASTHFPAFSSRANCADKRWILLITAIVLQVGCTKAAPDPAIVSLHGVIYEIPRREVHAASLDAPMFLRVRPSGGAYDLIVDELSHYAPNRQGPDIPTISRLNDNKFRDFEVHRLKSGIVICGSNQPYFNCGLRIVDGPVIWSVLFDRDQLPRADQIRSDATATIGAYRHRKA